MDKRGRFGWPTGIKETQLRITEFVPPTRGREGLEAQLTMATYLKPTVRNAYCAVSLFAEYGKPL